MTTIDVPELTTDDQRGAQEFLARVFAWINGGGVTLLIDVAHRSGLLAAAAEGPGTSVDLAARAGLSERHTRELLNGLAAAGVFTYTPTDGRYTLPPSHAACLAGDGPLNVAPVTMFLPLIARFVERVTTTVVDGGGIPYAAYRPELTDFLDQGMRRVYDALLLEGYVPAVPGLHDKLQAGCRVADLGCGTGHVDTLLAGAYPRSVFVGFDVDDGGLAHARREAAELGYSNVRFERQDVRDLPLDPPFDVILAFDAIHDQADPAGVLARAHAALAPGGILVMVDVNLSSNPEDNVDHPMAPWFYTASLFHCMQVSLAEGGAGLGTCWGWQKATQMLADAGFRSVEMIPAPEADPMNAIFVGR